MKFFIATKLHRPQIAENHLHRQHLLNRLDQRRHRPLTLISAPAGYGKTTLASCWLETCDVPSAWVALDKNDNDPYLFVSYLTGAVQHLFPDKLSKTQALLNTASVPPLTVLSNILVNDLEEVTEPFILALDDYHVIEEIEIHRIISTLLQHPPGSLHLVIISRHDPPLQLVSLRGRSQLTEIRAQELRFSKKEAITYFSQVAGSSLDATTATMLVDKTEGWVTGLRLSALSLQRGSDLKQQLSILPEKSRYVIDYIVKEVIEHEPDDIQEYLLKTSILERFCGPLCSAVADTAKVAAGSYRFLDWFQKHNLFIVHLDGEHKWFRYHQLFKVILYRVLKRRFGTDVIAALHIRAGQWFSEHGLLEESLNHLIEGGDANAAGDVLARHRHQLMNEEKWQMLGRYLRLLPDSVVDKNPGLLMAKAWLLQNQGQIYKIAPLVDQAQRLLQGKSGKSDTTKGLKGEFGALQSYQAWLAADSFTVIKKTRKALSALPENWSTIRGVTTMLLGGGTQMAGDAKKAKAIIYEALIPGIGKGKSYRTRLLTALCVINWLEADLREQKQASKACLKISLQHKLPESIAVAQYFMGIFHYYRNELVEAENVLTEAVKSPYTQNGLNFMGCTFVLVLTLEAMGRLREADECIQHHNSVALKSGNAILLGLMQGFMADLDLRRGYLDRANHWAKSYDPYPLIPMTRCYIPQVTQVKILLSQRTDRGLHEAAVLIKEMQAYYTRIHNKWFSIEIFALKSMFYDLRDDEARAMKALEQSVGLAQPGGIVRLFVDLGPRMADLLKRLDDSRNADPFFKMLLLAFGENKEDSKIRETERIETSTAGPRRRPAIGYLTKREIEVLKSLAQGSSNAEISDKLYISPETVKKHLYNIYKKLFVKNRHHAIMEAKSLGIL